MNETRLYLPPPSFQWSQQTGYDFFEKTIAQLCYLFVRSLRFLTGKDKSLHRVVKGFFPGIMPACVLRNGTLVGGHPEAVLAVRSNALVVELSVFMDAYSPAVKFLPLSPSDT